MERFREIGADAVKRGQDGEPDREVFWGCDLHFWVEFKKKGSTLRPSQIVWWKHKKPGGDSLYIIESREQVDYVISVWIGLHGPATAHRR